jgi:hypothetical protein
MRERQAGVSMPHGEYLLAHPARERASEILQQKSLFVIL